MNVKLLRRIQKAILAEPRRLYMEDWGGLAEEEGDIPKEQHPPCGTVACLAGHADWLTHHRLFMRSAKDGDEGAKIWGRAKKALELTDVQAERLFFLYEGMIGDHWWPKKYGDAYLRAKTPLQRARVAVKRIDEFIRSKGAR
jgi:hypothetical protein